MPPSKFLGLPWRAWGRTDHLLAMARRQCDQWVHAPCGVDKDIAFDPENDGWLEVDDSTVCVACAALERYEKEHEKSPPEPGTLLRVINTRHRH